MSPRGPAGGAGGPSAPERLLDLLALLTSERRPWSQSEIFEALGDAYAGDRESQERKLRRDREELEALGLPLQLVDDRDEGVHGYRVDTAAAWLPDVRLTPEEQAGLFAVAAAALEGGAPLGELLRGALVKLRAGWSRPAAVASPAVFVTRSAPAHLSLLTEAVADRRLVRLTYGGSGRLFEPYGVARSRGRVLVVGHCRLRDALRSFHVDRIGDCAWADPVGGGPDFEVPADFDPAQALVDQPWQLPLHPAVEVTLAFPPALAELGPRMLGLEPGAPCPATNLDGLAAQLLAMGDGVTIVAPPEAREKLRAIASELA